MTTEQFFEKFELFAGAPKAVATLRELVLQLAVRGQLTERIDGESCATQLKLAHAFRARHAKKAESNSDDTPFPIPANWAWVAVGHSMDMINGKAFKPEDWSTEGTPIIRIQNLNNPKAAFNRCKADLDPKIHVRDGDFLISWSGTPGTSFGAFIWNRGFAYLNQHIFRCELVEGVFLKEFLRLAINARLDEMISHAQGAVGLRHITKGKLESIRLPLPPLTEQKRIVAKVDELMTLCDQLEAQQQERETKHAALSAASLARFAEAPTPANFNFLFHHSYNISPADLRKTILTLAVSGELGAQKNLEKVRLDSLGKWAQGCGFPVAEQGHKDRPILFSKVSDMNLPGNEREINATNNTIDEQTARRLRVKVHPKGTVIFPKIGGAIATNKRRIIVRPTAIDNNCSGLTPNADCSTEWLYLVLSGIDFAEYQTGTSVPAVNQSALGEISVALPPLAEQKRIVAKVDELMTLVDQLEEQLASSRTVAAQLTEAVVAELTAAA